MRLKEIKKIKWVSKRLGPDTFKGYSQVAETGELIGEVGDFNIYRTKERTGGYELAIIVTTQEGKPVGAVYLAKDKRFKAKKAYTTAVEFLPEVQGMGLAPEVYRFLVRDWKYILVSDDYQSAGGQSIWRRLAAYPDIDLFAYRKPEGKKPQYSSVDVNDLNDLEGVFDVYPDPHADEEEAEFAESDTWLIASAKKR